MMKEGPGGGTLWMVQQMCNHGTLIEAGKRLGRGRGRGGGSGHCWTDCRLLCKAGVAAQQQLARFAACAWTSRAPLQLQLADVTCRAWPAATPCSGPRVDAQEAVPHGAA